MKQQNKNGEFIFQAIDNIESITNVFENNGKIPVSWHIAPNRNLADMKRGESHKIYTVAEGTKLIPGEVLKLTKSNDVKLHKVIMSLVFPEVMKEYREENDQEHKTAQIDHLSGNEMDCRIRNMWKTNKRTNLRGKVNMDKQKLLDRTCIYYRKDAEGKYIYENHKFVFVFRLGDYTKEEWKSLGKGEIIQEDNRKGDKAQYNFIEYKKGLGNIVVASFSSFDEINRFYDELFNELYQEEEKETGEDNKILSIERRNNKLKEIFLNYLNKDAEQIPGLEKIVLLADADETADGYIYFDNITSQEKHFIKAKKRGLVIGTEQDKETGKETKVLKNIANLKVSSDNIIDILYPYFDKFGF